MSLNIFKTKTRKCPNLPNTN